MSKHKPRLTDAEYAEMAADYEAHPPTAAEIAGPIEVNPVYLRTGRPAKGARTAGRTPVMAVRLPSVIRHEVDNRVKAGGADSASELIRQALVEYFDNHPVA